MIRFENDCWNCNACTWPVSSLFHAEILKSLTNNGIFDIESHTFAEDDIEFGDDDDDGSDNGDGDACEDDEDRVRDNRV